MTKPPVRKSMLVAGIMSGTSADGIDVALCRIHPGLRDGDTARIKLLHHTSTPYPRAVRGAVLAAMNSEAISVAELARLNWCLGELYADAVQHACTSLEDQSPSDTPALGPPKEDAGKRKRIVLDLIGLHGQTLYHQAEPARYLGKPVRATWQTGEASVVAERLRAPVVSDLRAADLAAGGQGAPLVPMLDFVLFRSAKISRVLQNLGGIGNLTALPAGCAEDGMLAFDTGPANMVIDACMERLYRRPFDRHGAVAAKGKVLSEVINELLASTYFSAQPPKSCGREQYGTAFVRQFIARCQAAGAADPDIIATASAFAAETILDQYRRFVWPHLGQAAPLARTEFIVAGGGTANLTLMRMLRERLEPLGLRVRALDTLGIPSQAKEAVAFALLAWLRWHQLPGNVPAATGASRPAILGRVTLA